MSAEFATIHAEAIDRGISLLYAAENEDYSGVRLLLEQLPHGELQHVVVMFMASLAGHARGYQLDSTGSEEGWLPVLVDYMRDCLD